MRTYVTQPYLVRPIPVLWCGRSKKVIKKERRKAVKKEKKNKKRERPPHSPSGKREPIRLGDGVLRHSFPWLASLLGCTVHALVAISPWSCYVPHTELSPLSFLVPYFEFGFTVERERERERARELEIPLYFWKKCVW
jgi:hypothetical protein